jgi:hypothetical protein
LRKRERKKRQKGSGEERERERVGIRQSDINREIEFEKG